MGRKRLPEEEKKVRVDARLPAWIIEKLKSFGKISEQLEKATKEYIKRQNTP